MLIGKEIEKINIFKQLFGFNHIMGMCSEEVLKMLNASIGEFYNKLIAYISTICVLETNNNKVLY